MIVLRSVIPAALVRARFAIAGCRTCAGDKQLAAVAVAAVVMVVHIVGMFFYVVVVVVCVCLIF